MIVGVATSVVAGPVFAKIEEAIPAASKHAGQGAVVKSTPVGRSGKYPCGEGARVEKGTCY